jgi:hypothetical protein
MTSIRACTALGAVLSLCPAALAQDEPEEGSAQARLDEQDLRIQSLEAALDEMRDQQAAAGSSKWETGYEKGFYIRSKESPFSMRINGRMQFRYTGFDPSVSTYQNLGTAASGQPIEVTPRNDFELERARLSFTGTTFDEDLHYYLNLDGDTDDGHQVIVHDFWFDYEFTKAFDLYVGKAFVPGSREWLSGSTSTLLIDRSMATSFFRPDRSVGVWAIGEPIEHFHYRAMVCNGFQTTDLSYRDINDDLTGSGTIWWEPNGKFGSGYADIKCEDELRTRFGSSFTYAGEDGANASGDAIPESNFLRLDDGTRLTDLGVDHFDVMLLALDAAMKLNGFSLAGEAYYRWVENIEPTAPGPDGFPYDSNESYGGFVGGGYMLIPETFDVQLRTSTVQGDFKDTWEYAGGVNYYLDGTQGNKLSLDLTHVDGSPVSSSGPNFRVGDDGWMLRLQLQLSF